MKGDFTRFTFQPKKHYSSVLMQQGRLQLDADWNEQMSILNHLGQLQTRDLIGNMAGTSQSYQIQPILEQAKDDFLITNGRFYIDGILCELHLGTSLPVERRSPKQIQVPVLLLDGQPFAKNQWIELSVPVDDKNNSFKPQKVKIERVNRNDFTLDLSDSVEALPADKPISLQRLTTYKTQTDYPNAGVQTPGIYLVYLDVWQRHITSLDDRTLQEVALNGLDTTTRLQTIAQVKLLNITDDIDSKEIVADDQNRQYKKFKTRPSRADLELLSAWRSLNRRAVLMNATTATDPTSDDTSGNYLGGDHRLYRVEIHRGGNLNEATFKWSRDNGSITSAIEKIEAGVVSLKGSTHDEYLLFGNTGKNSWVELITEEQELNNQPGVLVQVRDVKPPNLLLLDPSQIQGGALPQVSSETAEAKKYKVRRWDNQLNATDAWQVLEQGIRVKFDSLNQALFQTGDYWLIPARTAQPIQWSRDLPQAAAQLGNPQLGKPIAQAPDGIQHHFGILAVVSFDGTNFMSAVEGDNTSTWAKADFRTTFLPLIDRGSSSGIGTSSPEAQLHVRGNDSQAADGKIKQTASSPQVIEIKETQARILRGYTIAIGGKTALVTNAIVSNEGTTNKLVLTLEPPIDTLPSSPDEITAFRFQQPVARFETSEATAPQLFINSAGNIGVNTFSPIAKLEIRGIDTDSTTDLFHINQANGTNVLKVKPDSTIGVGIDSPQAKLDVRDTLRVTTAPAFIQIQPGKPVLFTSQTDNSGYSFDQSVIIRKGGITVEDNGGARISGLVNAQNGITVSAGGLSVKGDTLLSEGGQERVSVRGNAITLDGDITIKNSGNDRIAVRNTETTVNRNVNLATGNLNIATGNLTIVKGTLTIGGTTFGEDDLQVTQFNQPVTLKQGITVEGDTNFKGKIKLTNGAKPLIFELSRDQRLSLKNDTTPLVTLSFPSDRANPRLHIPGNMAIGTTYAAESVISPDGLLVEGQVGIGFFSSVSALTAKLEIKGTSDRDGAALNVTNQSGTSLLCVRNDGRVCVATKAPDLGVLADDVAAQVKLYTKGHAYVDGNLFAQKVGADLITGNDIAQVSSRSLKENVADLSSQEAIEMLKQLNPVKFNYTQSIDPTLHAGFIAEDVPKLLTSSDHQSVRILDVVAVLTRTVQDQRDVLIFLNNLVLQQQDEIAALMARMSQLEKKN